MTGTFERSDALLAEIRAEFPSFAVRPKRGSALQRAIDVALRVITANQMTTYLTRYHTVLFGTLWVPDTWDAMSDLDRYVLLRHERVHLRQRKRMGDVAMAYVYLVPIFPIGLAYGRARIEWEAYVETLRATDEVYGRAATLALRGPIVERFVGPDYGWMWPFRRTIERWFDEAVAALPQDAGPR
ncbi:MAG: hypothetical protein U0235_34325 [Polyangiaceae bacterium]